MKSSHPSLVRDVREWPRGLKQLRKARGCSTKDLIDQLRLKVQVHEVDIITFGEVPESMLGCWVTPELAKRHSSNDLMSMMTSMRMKATKMSERSGAKIT